VLALRRACPDGYTLERARFLVGSWDHLRVNVERGGRERFIRAHGIRAWGDVTAALVDARRMQVNDLSAATGSSVHARHLWAGRERLKNWT
jgi:hypothetical protein